jgi:hypothetical protein
MNVTRRLFNIIGASIPLGNLLAVGYPVEPPVEKMKAVLVTPIYKEWLINRNEGMIWDELNNLAGHYWFRYNGESLRAFQTIIDEVIPKEMKSDNPRTLQVSLSEDGEIGWGFVDDTWEPVEVPMFEKGHLIT